MVESGDSVLATQGRVIYALMLRDIRTRFFGHGLGYLIAIGWPLTHMAVLIMIYIFAGRTPALGDSLTKFLAIAVAPAISYMYLSRFIAYAVIINRPLLNYPIVQLADIMISRAILETVTSILCCLSLACILVFMDVSVLPINAPQAAAAFGVTILFGVGVGTICGLVATKFPGILIVLILFNVIVYVSSGIVFMPDALPGEIQSIVSWNPLLHSVEWIRESYYQEYKSHILDKKYLSYLGLILILASFFFERFFRRFLKS